MKDGRSPQGRSGRAAPPREAIPHTALILPVREPWAALVHAAADLWTDATTRSGTLGADELRRSKQARLEEFFAFVKKRPGDVTPEDVKSWRSAMEARGLAANSIYTRLSLLSSFYTWAAKHLSPDDGVTINPVRLARPKRPHPYQSESTKALSDDEVDALLDVLRSKAAGGDVPAKRDLALLHWYLKTGMRRTEVIGLRGRDVTVEADRLLVRGRVKGGFYREREIRDRDVRDALLDYLMAADRLAVLKSDAPLWTRHDRAGKAGLPLTSHSFARNLKRYAKKAGIDHIHLHQTRHTFARLVSEVTGSLFETQEALGHESPAVTRQYVQRIAVKRDRFSETIGDRFRRAADE